MYLPLARKYRPQTFQDLVGQATVTQALTNAITMNREPRSIILTGVRGVGKTTLARIYAKALNCEKGMTAEPCNTCMSCQSISSGTHEDVIEVDAASNTGVDDVRHLIETVSYRPVRSRAKVYIIDEVHMLSTSAFNALLKTLEEPPAHVFFIFATTELEKIPETIQSRCIVFNLRKISLPQLMERLEWILSRESVSFEKDAVVRVARAARGSLRDALTLLDYAIALGNGHLTEQLIAPMVASSSLESIRSLIEALAERSPSKLIEVFDQLSDRESDWITLCEQLVETLGNLLTLQHIPLNQSLPRYIELTNEEAQALRHLGQKLRPLDANRLIRTFAKCRHDLDGSGIDAFIFQNFCFEWCLDPGFDGLFMASTAAKPLEFSADVSPLIQPPLPQHPVEAPPVETVAPSAPSLEEADGFPSSWKTCVELWKKFKPLQARKLEEIRPLEFSPERIVLGIPEASFISRVLFHKDEQQKLKQAFQEMFEFNGVLEIKLDEPQSDSQSNGSASTMSILEENKIRRDQELREQKEALLAHPVTQKILSDFKGKIDRIEPNRP